jgi:phosphatidylglycerol---prolipoprotein diacylglyceryl transferase
LTRPLRLRYPLDGVHPILFTLRLSLETARISAILATIALAAFILWDGLRTKGKEKLAGIIAQAIGFLAVGLTVSIAALTPERVPDPLVLDIRSWGIFTVIGMCSCFLVQRHYGKRIGLTSEQILSIWVYGGVAAVVGARGLHVAVNWSFYERDPLSALAFWDGGMVYIGGVTASLASAMVYARKHKMGIRSFDIFALGVALTQGIGRIGCFLAGCCYGKETTLPWGVRFPEGSIALYTMQQTREVAETALATPPLHPTQLYEALACFLVGALLLAWYRRGTAKPGAIIACYFILYSTVRFFIELIRNDPERQFLFRLPEDAPLILSTSQVAGVVLALFAAALLWKIQRGAAASEPAARYTSRPCEDR